MIALAVGTVFAVLGFAAALSNTSRGSRADHGEDVKITAQGHHLLDTSAAGLIRAAAGVATVEPMFVTDAMLAGKDAKIWAVGQATMFHYRLAAGRWYTPAEEQSAATSPSSNATSLAPPQPGSARRSASRPPPERPASASSASRRTIRNPAPRCSYR